MLGNFISHYEVEDIASLSRLLDGNLLAISENKLIDVVNYPPSSKMALDENRIIFIKREEDKNLLLNLEPIRCYLRMPDMTSTVINVNPYQSVRWLKFFIGENKNISPDVRLITSSTEMDDN